MSEDVLIRLKYGSAPWNRWREANPDMALTLNGRCEKQICAANLTDAHYSAVDLRGALHVPEVKRT